MKRKILSVFLMINMVLSMISGAFAADNVTFLDVPSNHWASESVTYVYEKGLMNGEGPDTFKPDNNLTRAMFVTILGRMAGVNEDNYPDTFFADVPTGQWYSAYVTWAFQKDIVDGTGNGYFSPDENVTREQMATMIARYVISSDLHLQEIGSTVKFFTDQHLISSWASEGVELMRRTGILSGYDDGSFRPERTADRAEAATIFMRLDQAATHSEDNNDDNPEDGKTTAITQEDGKKMVDLVHAIGEMDRHGTTQAEVTAFLEEIDWIETVEETPNGGVTCKTEFGVTGAWAPQHDGSLGGADTKNTMELQSIPLSRVAEMNENEQEPLDIVILCPYASSDSSFNLNGYTRQADSLADYTGGTVTVIRDRQVTLQTLKELDQYDMVWFYSHGILSSRWMLWESEPYTLTGEFALSPTQYILWSEDFYYGRTIVDLNDGRLAVGGAFYEYYYEENEMDGMFFHFGSCYSMQTDALAQGILSRGADWVEGWTNSVFSENDYIHLTKIEQQLEKGVSIQKAVEEAAIYVQEKYPNVWQDDCVLHGLGDEMYYAISPKNTVDDSWRQAYCDYILHGLFEEDPSMGWTFEMSTKSTYYLFDANGDNVPELWIDNPFTPVGGRLCTYVNGEVVTSILYSSEVSYLPEKELVRVSVMRMGACIDYIYQITDGEFLQIARGDYVLGYVGSGNSQSSYIWNGTYVDETTYWKNLNAIYDTEHEIVLRNAKDGLNYQEILAKLD